MSHLFWFAFFTLQILTVPCTFSATPSLCPKIEHTSVILARSEMTTSGLFADTHGQTLQRRRCFVRLVSVSGEDQVRRDVSLQHAGPTSKSPSKHQRGTDRRKISSDLRSLTFACMVDQHLYVEESSLEPWTSWNWTRSKSKFKKMEEEEAELGQIWQQSEGTDPDDAGKEERVPCRLGMYERSLEKDGQVEVSSKAKYDLRTIRKNMSTLCRSFVCVSTHDIVRIRV